MNRRILRIFFRHSIPLLLAVTLLGVGAMAITSRFVMRENFLNAQSELEQIQSYYELILNEMDYLNLMFSTNSRIMTRLAELLESSYLEFTDLRDILMIQSYVSSLVNARPHIDSIYVYIPNSAKRVLTSSNGVIPLHSLRETSWYESYNKRVDNIRQDDSDFWVEVIQPEINVTGPEGKKILRIFRGIFDSVGKPKGVIILNLLEHKLSSDYPVRSLEKGQFITIKDSNNQMLLSIPPGAPVSPETKDYAAFSLVSGRFGWIYTMGIPYKNLQRLSKTIGLLTLLLATLVCILGTLLTYRTMGKERRFLQRMLDQLEGAGAGGLRKVGTNTHEDIFEFISRGVLQTFIEQDYLKVQKEAVEYRALQMQINPHFLFNILESINWKAVRLLNGPNDISRMILLVSKILKYAMDMRASIDVPLAEELTNARYYLEIQKYRFSENHAVTWSVSPNLKEYRVPRLLLQPILENCFNHGFSESEAILKIRIMIQKNEGYLKLAIKDNGSGMDQETLSMLNSETETPTAAYRSHIGISNVRKRLRLLYGFNASLEIHSQMNLGTEIIIKIPVEKEPVHKPGFLKETK